VLKIAGLHHKLWNIDYEQWLGAREAWAMATAGAQAMGDGDGLGRLEPGPARRRRPAPPREPHLHAAERPARGR